MKTNRRRISRPRQQEQENESSILRPNRRCMARLCCNIQEGQVFPPMGIERKERKRARGARETGRRQLSRMSSSRAADSGAGRPWLHSAVGHQAVPIGARIRGRQNRGRAVIGDGPANTQITRKHAGAGGMGTSSATQSAKGKTSRRPELLLQPPQTLVCCWRRLWSGWMMEDGIHSRMQGGGGG